MRRLALALLLVAAPAQASLAPGAKAPDFRTKGAIAGRVFDLRLADALRRGPVVLYFFPAAFTAGCTAEAHAFAEATDDFRAAGATVIGMSADPIAKLSDFSKEACRDKFAVASATPAIIRGYDVALPQRTGLSNRTSYVIAKGGRIAYAFSDLNPAEHVANTLAAVRRLDTRRR